MPELFLWLLIASGAGAPFSTPQDTSDEAVDTSRAPLLAHEALGAALAEVAAAHPDLVSIVPVGRSRSGRVIEAVRLSSDPGDDGRPAILLMANIDGPLVYTSGIALDHVRRLAAGYATDERIRSVLDSTTLYIVPRANPDAAEAHFVSPLAEARASGHAVDNDRDGRSGEDGPADVDGDGLVATMRIPDPEGEWMQDPTDPRVLVRARPEKGEHGLWKLAPEGRDSDGDGQASEDPVLDAIVNHNFPQDFEEHDPEAGLFPTDEPEARALCEFLLERRDIQLVLVYGELDNLVGEVKAVADDAAANKRVPESGIRKADADIVKEIGRRYGELTDALDAPPANAEGTGEGAGSFQAWCYQQRGLLTLSLSPWAVPLDEKAAGEADAAEGVDDGGADDEPQPDAPEARNKGKQKDDEPKPSDDARRMRWIDAHGEAARHLGWTPFEHPELGTLEIGGFAPYALIEPPDGTRVEIADRDLELLLALPGLLARAELVDARATDLGGGLLDVEVALVNEGLVPLHTWTARETKMVRPARVELRVPAGAELVAGERQQLVGDLGGSGSRRELRWLVRGAPASAIGISVDTDHAGSDSTTPEAK